MNYLHFGRPYSSQLKGWVVMYDSEKPNYLSSTKDSTHIFFFIKAVPMESTPSLLVGLALTSGMCVCERILTSRLETVSMALFERQPQRRPRRKDISSDVVEGPSVAFSPPRKRPSRGRFSQLGKEGSVRGLLLRKTVFYGLANVLRLGYMLLAMSFHIGVLLVIISSLTCTQLCLDLAGLSRAEEIAWSGYEQIGSTGAEATEEYSGDHHGQGLYDLDDERAAQPESGADVDVDLIPLRNHVALSRSHDCF